MDTRGLSLWDINSLECEADHSVRAPAIIKNIMNYTSAPQVPSQYAWGQFDTYFYVYEISITY
jgi:hypothetical protein